MNRKVIDEILKDIGLESLHEESEQQLKPRPVNDVIKHIVARMLMK